MCSWCWAFKPIWQKVIVKLPNYINTKYLLGGLAPDTDEPMPEKTREHIKENWKRIQNAVPETEFNFDFWHSNEPKRSTYIACRAVISSRIQHSKFETTMIKGIQHAYYLEAQNPSNENVLIGIAEKIGLNVKRFKEDLNSTKVNNSLKNEIELSRMMPINGFPSLVLSKDNELIRIGISYLDDNYIINQIIT